MFFLLGALFSGCKKPFVFGGVQGFAFEQTRNLQVSALTPLRVVGSDW